MAGSRRERELARAKYERQHERRVEETDRHRRRSQVIASLVVGALAIGAFALLANTMRKDSPSTPVAQDVQVCLYPAAGQPASKKVDPPSPTTRTSPEFKQATITFTQGPVQIQLLNKAAPCTVNSFTHLATSGFYDGTPCHRLTSGGLNVLQCGDPTGTGTGGPGYVVSDENLTGATYPAGTVAMANSGSPNSGGSQFFIVYKDSTLGPSYTPFGRVTKGLDVLTAIAAAGTQKGSEKPLKPVTITTITVDGS